MPLKVRSYIVATTAVNVRDWSSVPLRAWREVPEEVRLNGLPLSLMSFSTVAITRAR